MLVLEGLQVFIEPFSFFSITGQGIDLDYRINVALEYRMKQGKG